MVRKFYEEPTIQILRLESEVWFATDNLSVETDGEFGTGDGEDDGGWGDW